MKTFLNSEKGIYEAAQSAYAPLCAYLGATNVTIDEWQSKENCIRQAGESLGSILDLLIIAFGARSELVSYSMENKATLGVFLHEAARGLSRFIAANNTPEAVEVVRIALGYCRDLNSANFLANSTVSYDKLYSYIGVGHNDRSIDDKTSYADLLISDYEMDYVKAIPDLLENFGVNADQWGESIEQYINKGPSAAEPTQEMGSSGDETGLNSDKDSDDIKSILSKGHSTKSKKNVNFRAEERDIYFFIKSSAENIRRRISDEQTNSAVDYGVKARAEYERRLDGYLRTLEGRAKSILHNAPSADYVQIRLLYGDVRDIVVVLTEMSPDIFPTELANKIISRIDAEDDKTAFNTGLIDTENTDTLYITSNKISQIANVVNLIQSISSEIDAEHKLCKRPWSLVRYIVELIYCHILVFIHNIQNQVTCSKNSDFVYSYSKHEGIAQLLRDLGYKGARDMANNGIDQRDASCLREKALEAPKSILIDVNAAMANKREEGKGAHI